MLPRSSRLHSQSDFRSVLRRGGKITTPFFVFYYLPSRSSCLRFGFVVSTALSKKATIRNRLKRQLREITRKILPSCKTGFDCVVICRAPAIGQKYAVLGENLTQCLVRAGLLN